MMKLKYPKWLMNPEDRTFVTKALKVLDEIKKFEGKPYRELDSAVEEANRIEPKREMRKLRQEIATYIANTSEIEIENNIIPTEIRQFTFQTLWNRGASFITSGEDLFKPTRSEVLEVTANYFKLTSDLIEKYFYADTPENKLVSLQSNQSPAQILVAINSQRLKQRLRRATKLIMQLPKFTKKNSSFVQIFLALKRNHLIYEIIETEETILFTITGPYSLFDKTTIYGNRLADFVVSVIKHCSGIWKIQAEILPERSSRIAENSVDKLNIDGTMRGFFTHEFGEQIAETYKSGDEEAFQRYLERTESQWTISYEASLIPIIDDTGKSAGFMIPDFVVHNPDNNERAIIEIVGFWREDYLRKKIEKVKLLKNRKVFLIINSILKIGEVGASKLFDEIPNVEIFYYSNRTELKAIAKEISGRLEVS
ncbi:MAG: DUF790 family protein [Bacteroidetes bacterium]|nr:DUF790 family protein [Bacteroidota bacterium]